MSTPTTEKVRHPARYSKPVLEAMDMLLPRVGLVLDPFAGTGLVAKLGKTHWLPGSKIGSWQRTVIGVEIEPEWAALDPCVLVGDATRLPFANASFDAIATSPAFGNRMADKHNATDDSVRNTYKHALGRDLHEKNSGGMQWGHDYRILHLNAWHEAARVTKLYGVLVLNVKDHYRNGERQHVSAWHVNALGRVGFALDKVVEIGARGNRQGANRTVRTSTEFVMRFVKAGLYGTGPGEWNI